VAGGYSRLKQYRRHSNDAKNYFHFPTPVTQCVLLFGGQWVRFIDKA
jgi:hypothetical protein